MSDQLSLHIGNKAYSSWSLRPWLAMKMANIPFAEIMNPLFTDGHARRMEKLFPSRKVPTLCHGGVTIWESLAICEYLAELYPDVGLWPTDPKARAVARSIASEMPAGFMGLRSEFPMNIRRKIAGVKPSEVALGDIKRLGDIWSYALDNYGGDGPFLFGAFSIADAIYAPVVTRLDTYGLKMSPQIETYMQAVLTLEPMKAWYKDALQEAWIIERVEL